MTDYRPELAESHEGFFKSIDKIKDPKYQEWAVREWCQQSVRCKKHDSVIPLINALESSTLSRNVKDVAIQWHFMKEQREASKILWRNCMSIQQLHLREYANGLINSWNDKLTVFQFLLAQADQGDLKEVKKGGNIRKIKNSVKPLMMPSKC